MSLNFTVPNDLLAIDAEYANIANAVYWEQIVHHITHVGYLQKMDLSEHGMGVGRVDEYQDGNIAGYQTVFNMTSSEITTVTETLPDGSTIEWEAVKWFKVIDVIHSINNQDWTPIRQEE